ncbi:OB-fold nucleic acid binding domain-containing protein [Halococcus dombrowskii]|uniref:OB-fold nucleic acid binding domain-containing protein n=1 Tax=Halococcus dombrowskii TaxID=179637 RepID=A0AAV3SJE4_HALDO|nr:OB-fold nucleic acid binding domain-containing protein [Halococcus dombrowskii]UOO95966.1 OB-fold nucleic acid binding domain-containing protein [Halococcus dombrowskii]
MGSCIICGTSTDGYICESHEEDVVFAFEGSHANQLTPGRFYRGSVDGFAEFGVFIDIGDSVTGLLHRSELDSRLESLDWDSGDTVYVQVTDVHDNGNVDLTWSIRQADREFRGSLVDTPEGDELPDEAEAPDPNERAVAGRPATDADESAVTTDEPQTGESSATVDIDGASTESETDTNTERATGTSAASAADDGEATLAEPDEERERVAIDELESRVGDEVRVEGAVASVRQTGGPTVFTLHDETGTVDCAAFEEAGVRAYPDVEQGAVVAIEGRVERHREEIQVEASGLAVLDDEEREAVEDRMEEALAEQAQPGAVAPLAEDGAVDDRLDEIRDLAGLIRRAVLDSRPVIVRHDASADGYVAASAIERATLPLVRDEHAERDAEYHYFDRRPLGEGVYDMNSATRDVTKMLDANERHDEKIPLFVFCGVGGTGASKDGLELLSVYDADRAVVSDGATNGETAESFVDTAGTTASAIAATVAVHVDPDARDDLEHLPAVSFWEDTPEAYAELASEAGYDPDRARDLRQSVALVANYQAYEDKRELVADLLFDGRESLAARLATQFREKLDTALETARTHLERHEVDGTAVNVLDTDAFTHRYDFPPTGLLCDELHRRTRDDAPVLLGIGEDELLVRHVDALDLDAVAADVADGAPDADVSVGATGDDRLTFLVGERAAVREAAIEAVAERS